MMNILPRTRSEIKNDFIKKYQHNLTHKDKSSSIETFKGVIEEKLKNCKTANEAKIIINTAKLALKTIQENLNHNGTSYFKSDKYYGEIDQGFFAKLTENSLKKNLENICMHRNSGLGNRKLSLYGTNYTGSANEIRKWLDNPPSFIKNKVIEDTLKTCFKENKAIRMKKDIEPAGNRIRGDFFRTFNKLPVAAKLMINGKEVCLDLDEFAKIYKEHSDSCRARW